MHKPQPTFADCTIDWVRPPSILGHKAGSTHQETSTNKHTQLYVANADYAVTIKSGGTLTMVWGGKTKTWQWQEEHHLEQPIPRRLCTYGRVRWTPPLLSLYTGKWSHLQEVVFLPNLSQGYEYNYRAQGTASLFVQDFLEVIYISPPSSLYICGAT